jgi:probable selenium-dependent hydroxylase accessory protein YqeC
MSMTIEDALDIKSGEVISLVGGGGKTTIMFKLAGELSRHHKCVITTTTTKIFEPSSSETQLVLVEADEQKLMKSLLRNMDDYHIITLARERLALEKLGGISTDLIAKLAQLETIYSVVVEADGAAHRPLKAPNATEPIIPNTTSTIIAVMGIDGFGCKLNDKTVFRAEIAAGLLGMSMNEKLTPEAIAVLITHPSGITKGSPENARIIPFINKADLDPNLIHSNEIAKKILAAGHPRIGQVIIGQAQLPDPVLQVICA